MRFGMASGDGLFILMNSCCRRWQSTAPEPPMKKSPVNPRLPPPYNKMTAEELDAEVERFDRESPPGLPLTPSQKLQHRRTKRRAGRPVVRRGAERVTITVERGLLRAADTFARKMKMSRSQLIANGIREVMRMKKA